MGRGSRAQAVEGPSERCLRQWKKWDRYDGFVYRCEGLPLLALHRPPPPYTPTTITTTSSWRVRDATTTSLALTHTHTHTCALSFYLFRSLGPARVIRVPLVYTFFTWGKEESIIGPGKMRHFLCSLSLGYRRNAGERSITFLFGSGLREVVLLGFDECATIVAYRSIKNFSVGIFLLEV